MGGYALGRRLSSSRASPIFGAFVGTYLGALLARKTMRNQLVGAFLNLESPLGEEARRILANLRKPPETFDSFFGGDSRTEEFVEAQNAKWD